MRKSFVPISVTSTGTDNVFILTVSKSYLAYENGDTFYIESNQTLTDVGTDPPAIQVVGKTTLAEVPLKDSKGNDLADGDIKSGDIFQVCYRQTSNQFRIVGSALGITVIDGGTF